VKATLPDEIDRPAATDPESAAFQVVLAEGTIGDLRGRGRAELVQLQWREERAFARRILAAPKGSAERARAVEHAYDTVTKIFAAAYVDAGKPLVMGLHPRYEKLLRKLLAAQASRGLEPHFFEIGYGSGLLLKRVSDWGFSAAGIEVSPSMHGQACRLLGPDHQVDLHLGDFLKSDFAEPRAGYTLAYWNDVFEHVPPDEILDYLRKIHEILVPGGQLVTITPNWHMRPSDVTRAVRPPRTEAAGLHLREYTLREVTGLLDEAGFAHVATPLVAVPARALLWGRGLAGLKCRLEPWLERLPPGAARLLCRGLGLSETIATKGRLIG